MCYTRTMCRDLCVAFCMVLMLNGVSSQQPADPVSEVKKVSQCYQPGGFSFVSLYCGYGRVIQIQRAFHGTHRNPALSHCGSLDGDCTDETTHTYDWTKCEGRHNCVQMIQSQAMPQQAGCVGTEMLYLEVHYTCVEGTIATTTTTTKPPTNGMMDAANPTPPSDLHTICTNYTTSEQDSVLHVISPGYPYYYPSDTECRCVVKAQPDSKVTVTYQDLALLMRASQCVDWLLLQSLGFKNSAAVTCGQMASGQEKTLTAKGNWLLLHFHTARAKEAEEGNEIDNNDLDLDGKVMKKMKGFQVKVQSQPPGMMQVQCYRASSSVLANLKYKNSQQDASDNIILPQSDLSAIAKPSTANNSVTSITTNFSIQVMSLGLSVFILSYQT